MQPLSEKEQAALCGLLREAADDLGAPVPAEWAKAVTAAPRHRFLPPRVWLIEGDGYAPCDAEQEPDRWLEAAYADAPVVTQVNDGQDPGDEDVWPSSSASAPSIVLRMLRELDVRDGMNVLEIGTGTGWNAGLLSARLGSDRVTTVEVDLGLADQATDMLKRAGYDPCVVGADGAEGHAARGPYDRVIATCSVQEVPYPWVAQTRPGGVILTPWETPWFCYGLLRLTVEEDGSASGRFSPHSAFMLMRGQRIDLRIFRDVVRDEHTPVESCTSLSPWSVTGDDWTARFAVGMQLRDVWHTWQDEPDLDGVQRRLWVATADAKSWAAVDWDGHREDRFTVWQHGPRRLWDEVEAAHLWWLSAGMPRPEEFGLTVTPEGERFWLRFPDKVVSSY
ncbi:methyltransferase [Streptomyces sp. NPDC002055]|uniref:methyltransferase n=1 Tax=Streptomyces sp. NPDC002055 TaxID=3154534 RepID=UPI00332E3C43